MVDPFILRTNEKLVAWRVAVDLAYMAKEENWPDSLVYVETWSPSKGWSRGRVVASFPGSKGLDMAQAFVKAAIKKEDPWWFPEFFTDWKPYPNQKVPRYITSWNSGF